MAQIGNQDHLYFKPDNVSALTASEINWLIDKIKGGTAIDLVLVTGDNATFSLVPATKVARTGADAYSISFGDTVYTLTPQVVVENAEP